MSTNPAVDFDTSRRQRQQQHQKQPAAGLLTWRRAQTPLCINDRALKAFRHRQNPWKPLPLPPAPAPPPPASMRPKSAARPSQIPMIDYSADIDRGIIDWVNGASAVEKRLAFNLMRCMLQEAEPHQHHHQQQQQMMAMMMSTGGISQTHVIAEPAAASINMHQQQQQQQQLPQLSAADRPQTASRFVRARAEPKSARPGGRGATRVGHAQPVFDRMATTRQLHQGQRLVLHGDEEDYVNAGAGFLNARPAPQESFTVHPEWVSERITRLRALQRLGDACSSWRP